jgi:5-methylcytosine-specific restriction endonuclease McrA
VLEARTGGSATLGSGAIVSGDQARRLADDASITRIVTKGRSEVLDVGRSTRSVPPAIAKAVIARDRHCRYRGCTSPPWACDVHHLVPWASGGPTALANLGLLCWHHHAHVHRVGPEQLMSTPDGRWEVTVASAAA